jgi:hypothetical protein
MSDATLKRLLGSPQLADWVTFLGLVDLEEWVGFYGSTVSSTDRGFPPVGVTVSR